MKLSGNLQIPNMVVYATLCIAVFGISIWLLLVDKDSPTNWFLYAAMIVLVFAGLIKFAVHSRIRQQKLAADGRG